VIILRLAALLLTAIAMSAGFAHLLALPNKMAMGRADYLVAQQACRGWALLGVVVIGALIANGTLAALVRASRTEFRLVLIATLCVVLSLIVFFLFTFPANQATANWTVLPDDWEALRRQWEYSHAIGAMLYFVAVGALGLSFLVRRP